MLRQTILVRERQTVYTVTHRGEPVAVLSPLPAPIPSVVVDAGSWPAFLTALDEIGQDWRSQKSGLEILADVRR